MAKQILDQTGSWIIYGQRVGVKGGEAHVLEDDIEVICCFLKAIILDNVGVLGDGKKGQSKKCQSAI